MIFYLILNIIIWLWFFDIKKKMDDGDDDA